LRRLFSADAFLDGLSSSLGQRPDARLAQLSAAAALHAASAAPAPRLLLAACGGTASAAAAALQWAAGAGGVEAEAHFQLLFSELLRATAPAGDAGVAESTTGWRQQQQQQQQPGFRRDTSSDGGGGPGVAGAHEILSLLAAASDADEVRVSYSRPHPSSICDAIFQRST
jgi:hypothetical protein